MNYTCQDVLFEADMAAQRGDRRVMEMLLDLAKTILLRDIQQKEQSKEKSFT